MNKVHTTSPDVRLQRSVWWIWPAAPILLLAIPAAIAALLVPETTYIEAWRTQKNIDLGTTMLFLAGLGAFLAGLMIVALGRRARWESPSQQWGTLSNATVDYLEKSFNVLVGLSLFGYGAWVANGIFRGGLRLGDLVALIQSLDAETLGIKDKLPNIAGVTTLTQVAILAVIVGALVDINRPSARVRNLYRLLIFIGAVRAFALTERLALVELVVPLAVIRAAGMMARGNARERMNVVAAPVAGLVAVVLLFGTAEYARSWNFYSEVRDQPFAAFVGERMAGYYATSYNNGALLLRNDPRNNEAPFHTVTFLWEGPAQPVSEALQVGITGSDIVDEAESRKSILLRRKGNPEFNSPSGVAAPFIDYGYIGGAIFFVLLGLLIGTLHLSFLRSRLWGLLFYPIAFVGILELPRYIYWAQGRTTPALLGAAMVVFFVARHASATLRTRTAAKEPSAPTSVVVAVPASEVEVLPIA